MGGWIVSVGSDNFCPFFILICADVKTDLLTPRLQVE